MTTARQKARDYKWSEAADLCQQALALLDLGSDTLEIAQVEEYLAICRFREAFQTGSRMEFVGKMLLARESADGAATLFGKLDLKALAKRSASRGLFASFWIAESSDERRKIVEGCISLSEGASQVFESEGNKRQLAETRKATLTYLVEAINLASDNKSLSQRFSEAAQAGRTLIEEFASLADQEGLLDALQLTLWLLAVTAVEVLEPSQFKSLSGEVEKLSAKLLEVSKRVGTPYALSLAKEAFGNIAYDIEGNHSKALDLFEAAASIAADLKDSLVNGRIQLAISSVEHWRAQSKDYLLERREALDKGLKRAEVAIRNLEIPLHTSFLSLAYSLVSSCHIDLATSVETETTRKRVSLDKSVETARKGLSFEQNTLWWRQSAHTLSKALYFLATLEQDPGEKIRLLNEALSVREETVRVSDLLFPESWARGVMRNYLALIKTGLASAEPDSKRRVEALQAAVADMQECLSLCVRWTLIPGFSSPIARYGESYGDILFQLYSLTLQPDTAQAAIKAYKEALENLTRTGGIGPLETLNWKAGKVYDALGDFESASEYFKKAAEHYSLGAKRIPSLSSTFEDLAFYMEGWAEIETARLRHTEEDYLQAHENYAKAAKIFEKSRTWNFLSGLCTARSLLEKGEAFSRDERHSASIESFVSALNGFQKAKVELDKRERELTGTREEQELKDWRKISFQRQTYSRGRIELEQAKALDKKGAKNASSKKYASASETFKRLLTDIDIGQERGELMTLAQFCEAWAKMKEAESNLSPELYALAAEIFLGAKGMTSQEKFRFLALANASICKALEAGTKFRLTRNTGLYPEIKNRLETATDYYVEAGFKKTASWTRATQRLFDALTYLADAETERDRSKKTELYDLAEKHLELAAKLYGEAGFTGKKEEALKHLGRAREEKELLIASIEALAEIPIASGSSVLALPPGRSQPQGLERFEEAFVVGDLNVPGKELSLGSQLILDMEIANVGKAPATLVKVQGVLPEGLELGTQSEFEISPEGGVDLKGRRLEHLKTHRIKIPAKAVRKGEIELRPRLFYVDDVGNYKTYQFQPTRMTVFDLGVPDKPVAATPQGVTSTVSVGEGFRFDTERAREVFQRLIKEFLADYMSRRLYVDKAGWRSLMELVREMKIPRSALYGPRGRDGPVLLELERRGLIETRIFPKERGRGGAVKRVRVAYGNEIVRRLVDEIVKAGK